MLLVVVSAGATEVSEQVQDCVLRYSSHAASGIDGCSLYQSRYDLSASFDAQYVHRATTRLKIV